MAWKALHQRHRDERRAGIAQPGRQAAERAAEREREQPSGCSLTLEEIDRRLAEAGLLPRAPRFPPQ